MNQLKERLETKLASLKRGEILYFQNDREADVYAFCFINKDAKGALKQFFQLGGPISLLVSNQNKLARTRDKIGDSIVLKGNYSPEGILNLVDGHDRGSDRILLRVVDNRGILKDKSVEGRLVEFASNVEGEEHVLIYTRLADKELADKKLLLNTDDVDLSRFFNPRLIQMTGVTKVELQQGDFKLYSFYSEIDMRYHWAFVCDDHQDEIDVPLVRIESECLTGHVLGSQLCDCGDQLSKGLEEIKEYGFGALVYLRQEGRGIGLKAKLEAYHFQQFHGMDTVDANLAVGMPEEARDYLIGAQILNYLKYEPLKLLTNNPAKIVGLYRYGLMVEQQVSHIIPPSKHNKKYLATKRDRMGHRM